MMNQERDEKICQMYINGTSVRECSEKFLISLERVRQILRKADVFPVDQKTEIGLIEGLIFVEDSSRNEFLGVNISMSTKNALKKKADRCGVSMSRLASDTLDEMLAMK